ncbi:MAG: hypothetical protein ACTHN7_12250 [Solirubrobacterales bacterium]
MPTADTGNWDLVIEVATSALQRAVGGLLPTSTGPSSISNATLKGTITPHLAPGAVSLATGGEVTLGLLFDGTEIEVEEVFLPIPVAGIEGHKPAPWLSKIVLRGQVHVTDHLEMRGNDLVIDFSHDSARSQPAVSVALDESSLLAAPLIQFILAAAFLSGGETVYNATRQLLVSEVEAQIKQQVLASLPGVVAVVPAPNISGHPITASALLTQSQSLHLCFALCNPAGSTALITRSMLLTTSAGTTADVAAFAISNASLLGCFVKPEAMSTLGLPASGFRSDHPCFFLGSNPIPIPGLPSSIAEANLNTLIAGIDESGLLRIQAGLSAVGPAEAFHITTSIDVALSINASVSGGNLAIEIAEARPPIFESEVSIEWWVYVAGGLTGGLGIAAILALGDIFGGKALDALLSSLIKRLPVMIPSVSAPLPTAATPVRVREVTRVEADSPRRTLNLFGFPMSDPFRSHDIIVHFI